MLQDFYLLCPDVDLQGSRQPPHQNNLGGRGESEVALLQLRLQGLGYDIDGFFKAPQWAGNSSKARYRMTLLMLMFCL